MISFCLSPKDMRSIMFETEKLDFLCKGNVKEKTIQASPGEAAVANKKISDTVEKTQVLGN